MAVKTSWSFTELHEVPLDELVQYALEIRELEEQK